jgi:hypothetical protein
LYKHQANHQTRKARVKFLNFVYVDFSQRDDFTVVLESSRIVALLREQD